MTTGSQDAVAQARGPRLEGCIHALSSAYLKPLYLRSPERAPIAKRYNDYYSYNDGLWFIIEQSSNCPPPSPSRTKAQRVQEVWT